MREKERYAAIFILLTLSFGFLFISLSRYRFYQKYINVTYIKNQQNSSSDKGSSKGSQKIDINSADVYTLTKLPGIGRETALKIVEYRTKNGGFKSIDELINVKGIGIKKLEKLKMYVKIKEL